MEKVKEKEGKDEEYGVGGRNVEEEEPEGCGRHVFHALELCWPDSC